MKTVLFAILAAAMLVGCASMQEWGSSRLKKEMERLVRENRFDDARNVNVNRDSNGALQFSSSEEQERDELIASLVNPAEAKFVARRIRELRDLVLADLNAGKDDEARKHIYEFGTIVKSGNGWHPQPTANGLIFIAKCGLLNSRVNPATFKRIKAESTQSVAEALKSGDFQRAAAVADGLQPVQTYPEVVDTLLDQVSEEAVAQRCQKGGVEALVAATKLAVYGKTAFREGYEKTEFIPDWDNVSETLGKILNALVADDVPLPEAQSLVDNLLSGIQALFVDDETGENMTTAQLNDAIAALRADLHAEVNKALDTAIAAAKTDEAARLAALRKSFAKQALAMVDPASRVAAFTGAIGSCADSGMNRILGDAARVLRLSEAGKAVSSDDANSLLAASIFMGFADTAKLALLLKADVNGASPKDDLRRTPLLLSLQFGSRGKIGPVLATADRTIRDANGYGAIHYAVRYADETTLQKLIELGLDAKTPASDGVTPLMVAADMGNEAFAQALVAMSDVNAADAQGRAALHFAAKTGSLPIVRILVRNGANAEAVTKEGDSVLDVAVALPSEGVIAFLLDDAKVKPDERAIDWCVINGKVIPLTTLVAHCGAVTDRHLAAAVKCGHYDMVKYLVALGCDVNANDVHGVFAGASAEIREFLLANGFRESDKNADFVKYQ